MEEKLNFEELKKIYSPQNKIGVIGAGSFGSFFATVLSTIFDVEVWSPHSKFEFYPHLKNKSENKITQVSFEELLKNKLIFLCSSIDSLQEVAKKISSQKNDNLAIVETCSIKIYPAKILQKHLPAKIEFYGTHPMFGPQSAKDGLENLPIAMCGGRASENLENFLKLIFDKLQLRQIFMSAEEHDKAAANSQALTHFVGRLLSAMPYFKSDCPIATSNYKKLQEISTSVCSDSDSLFYAMQNLNPYAKTMQKDFSRSLKNLLSKIKRNKRRN